MENKIVQSQVYSLEELFNSKFDVGFYQREYVWERKQMEDLLMDLSTEFLKNYQDGDPFMKVDGYDPYYMGEIVLSLKSGQRSSIIDGQQRITSLTLLLIYLERTYGKMKGFPDVSSLIYSDYYGTKMFNLDIDERRKCMLALYNEGAYVVSDDDTVSVRNIVDRYNDIPDCWNERINDANIIHFVYWLKGKVMFSKVWTNSDEFAYVIFETMNDRGLSLTQVEMLRSYLLANVNPEERDNARHKYDSVVKRLMTIKLGTRSKAEFEFFKIYFRGHYAEDLSQAKGANSDFIRIGKEFHRWVRDNCIELSLNKSEDFIAFIERIDYFSKIYARINKLIINRKTDKYLYLVVNSDYKFTLQPALILAAVKYGDSDNIVEEKIQVVSKYITKLLTWRVWNHWLISQNTLESQIYELCKKVRAKSLAELNEILLKEPLKPAILAGAPVLNQQNKQKLKVLLALITAIVAQESGEASYILNQKDIEVEHIWANHYDQHKDEFENEDGFAAARNTIGDLLCLPKSFNASYNDAPYEVKIHQYFSQNILAQSLNEKKYKNNPGFAAFIKTSGIPFRAYEKFTRQSILERTDLYRTILRWNWDCLNEESIEEDKNEQLQINEIAVEESYRAFWRYALPIMQEAHKDTGIFSHAYPCRYPFINGYFGISQFYVSCTIKPDSIRVDLILAKKDKELNKNTFDYLLMHKKEIEEMYGSGLEWNRADEYKSSMISQVYNSVDFRDMEEWTSIASIFASTSRRICDAVLPFLYSLYPESKPTSNSVTKARRLYDISTITRKWALGHSQKGEVILTLDLCNRPYYRFKTEYMSKLFPDIKGAPSAWGTENHYFYEVVNTYGKKFVLQLAINSKNISTEQRELSDRINEIFAPKDKVVDWEYRVPFKKPLSIGDGDISEAQVMGMLEKGWDYLVEFENKLKQVMSEENKE